MAYMDPMGMAFINPLLVLITFLSTDSVTKMPQDLQSQPLRNAVGTQTEKVPMWRGANVRGTA
jgi:hypothetical protein